MQKEIKQTWQFDRSPQEVWEYLTKPELIEQWLMKNNFRPVVGHKFQFTFTESNKSQYAGIVNCEVLEVAPFTKLSYSWNGKTKDGSRTFISTVMWTLIPKDSGTELQLSHKGFAVLEDILTHTSGWDACLKRFEELINSIKK